MANHTKLCPRCESNRFTPYGDQKATDEAPSPALSRTDNQTYICSPCGTDEAMRDLQGLPPIAPTDWPWVEA